MNYPTCYRCPLRKNSDGTRCKILQERADAIKGLGFTSAKWKCEKRLALFQPGDVVEFNIYDPEPWGEDDNNQDIFNHRGIDCRGVVMRVKQRGILVYVDAEEGEGLLRPILNLGHDRVTKTGEYHPVCIHCGKPKGVSFKVSKRYKNGEVEEHEWDCSNYAGAEGGEMPPCHVFTQEATP